MRSSKPQLHSILLKHARVLVTTSLHYSLLTANMVTFQCLSNETAEYLRYVMLL